MFVFVWDAKRWTRGNVSRRGCERVKSSVKMVRRLDDSTGV